MRLINKHAFCGFYRKALKGFFPVWGAGVAFGLSTNDPRLRPPFNVGNARNTNSKTVAAVDVVGSA